MGLTASEDIYTLAIFLNCCNIHYLLRVIYESHFSTFSHILHKMVYKYQMPEVKRKVDKTPKDYIIFTFFFLYYLFNY